MNLKTKISGNKVIGNLRYQYQRIMQYPHYRNEMKKIEGRKNGHIPPQFAKIKTLENCCAGKRCFIISDGSGLTIPEMEMLKHEITFGAISVLRADGWKDWKPTYLGIQDPHAYKKLEQSILSDYGDNVFVGDNLAEQFDLPERLIQFPYLGVYKYYMNRYLEYNTKFSGNAFEVVYDGYSIVYSMLQIAVYMGFQEIYLFGCDCCCPENEKTAAAYRVAKQYADTHGIQIINCTHGDETDIFSYQSLNEILRMR